MITNPHNLPKIRSTALRQSAPYMPCTLQISSLLPGRRCSEVDTNILAHLPVFGKGFNTKVSDLFMACSCFNCHEILDGRDIHAHAFLTEKYPTALMERVFFGHCETLNRWLEMGLLVVPDAKIVGVDPIPAEMMGVG